MQKITKKTTERVRLSFFQKTFYVTKLTWNKVDTFHLKFNRRLFMRYFLSLRIIYEIKLTICIKFRERKKVLGTRIYFQKKKNVYFIILVEN